MSSAWVLMHHCKWLSSDLLLHDINFLNPLCWEGLPRILHSTRPLHLIIQIQGESLAPWKKTAGLCLPGHATCMYLMKHARFPEHLPQGSLNHHPTLYGMLPQVPLLSLGVPQFLRPIGMSGPSV